MAKQSKWHTLQYLGLIIALIGIAFLAFPGTLGLFSLRVITFIFLIISLIGVSVSLSFRSTPSLIMSGSVFLMCLYTFINPDYLLFVIGIAFVVNGINGIYLYFFKKRQVNENTVITSLLFILLGVFAILNAEAAISTVMMILGILLIAVGMIIFIFGKSFKLFTKFDPSSTYAYTSNTNTSADQSARERRVVVDIKSDDVEEVDFKDVK